MSHGDPDLMTLSQAAKFLRVRPTDMMSAVKSGELPYHQQRGRLWFSRAELLQSLATPSPSATKRPPHGDMT